MFKEITDAYVEAGLVGVLLCLALFGLVKFITVIVKGFKDAVYQKDSVLKEKYDAVLKRKDEEIEELKQTIEQQKAQLNYNNEIMQGNFQHLLDVSLKNMNEVMIRSMEQIEQKHIKERKELSNQNKNNAILKILKELLTYLGADRISLFEFHNGGLNMNGNNFQKMSCTNQIVRDGISSTQVNFQNIFQSSLQHIVNCLESDKTGFYALSDINNIREEHYHTFRELETSQIKSAFFCAIHNEGIIIGFIIVEYTEKAHLQVSDEVIKETLIKSCTDLEDIL